MVTSDVFPPEKSERVGEEGKGAYEEVETHEDQNEFYCH